MLIEAHKKFGRVTRCPFNIFNTFCKCLVSYKVCCGCLVPRGRQEATLLCCVRSRTGGRLGTHTGAMRPIWGRVECPVGFNWSKWGRGDCSAGRGPSNSTNIANIGSRPSRMHTKIVEALSISYRRDTTLQIGVKTAFRRMSIFSRASSCVHRRSSGTGAATDAAGETSSSAQLCC